MSIAIADGLVRGGMAPPAPSDEGRDALRKGRGQRIGPCYGAQPAAWALGLGFSGRNAGSRSRPTQRRLGSKMLPGCSN